MAKVQRVCEQTQQNRLYKQEDRCKVNIFIRLQSSSGFQCKLISKRLPVSQHKFYFTWVIKSLPSMTCITNYHYKVLRQAEIAKAGDINWYWLSYSAFLTIRRWVSSSALIHIRLLVKTRYIYHCKKLLLAKLFSQSLVQMQ